MNTEESYMELTDCQQAILRDEIAFQTENTLVKPRKLSIFEFIWMEITRYTGIILYTQKSISQTFSEDIHCKMSTIDMLKKGKKFMLSCEYLWNLRNSF
jgi:hypothetical protein